MPKVLISTAEKKKAESEKKNKQQDILLVAALKEAVRNKYTYEELAQAAGVNKSTIQKAMNNPGKMRIDLLRKICLAAGVNLEISGTAEIGA